MFDVGDKFEKRSRLDFGERCRGGIYEKPNDVGEPMLGMMMIEVINVGDRFKKRSRLDFGERCRG